MLAGSILKKVTTPSSCSPEQPLIIYGRCAPTYLTPQAHVKLSSPGAFDGLRIHTDEINEVIARITPRSLTIAVVSYLPVLA